MYEHWPFIIEPDWPASNFRDYEERNDVADAALDSDSGRRILA